jgi:hypothetical protein
VNYSLNVVQGVRYKNKKYFVAKIITEEEGL